MKDHDKLINIIKKDLDVRAGEEAFDRMMDATLNAYELSQAMKPAATKPDIRRQIMRSPITKIAAAAVIVGAVVLSMHFWDKLTPAAYAWDQTVTAMRGKRSFHIQTYFRERRKDEFWAEFDEGGNLIRYRQREGQGPDGSLITLWDAGIQRQYWPQPWGVQLMQHVENSGGGLEGLEEFDPETIVQEIDELVAEGKAVMEVEKPAPYARLKAFRVTRTDGKPLRQVVVVDPATKLVVRIDNYWGQEGEDVFHKGTEVLEYNEAMDPELFEPNFPADTIVVDQVSQKVGLAKGQMSDEEVAVETLRQALDALARDDYTSACKLCGGAPIELMVKFLAQWRPVSEVSFGSPEFVQNILPVYKVKCTYDIERNGLVETVSPTFVVREIRGQPGRWYVTWYVFTEDEADSSD